MLLGVILIIGLFQRTHCSGVKDFGKDYGRTWMLFRDEKGFPHYINLTHGRNAGVMPLCSYVHEKIYFDLFTKANQEQPEALEVRDKDTVKSKQFKENKLLVMIAHGWTESSRNSWMQNCKDAFIKKFDCNVILVGWQKVSSHPIFNTAACRSRHVGTVIGKMISAIKQSFDFKQKIYLVGHGLGAHVMGFTGKEHGGNIDVIVGLDPSRPYFEFPFLKPCNRRLDRSDAKFVAVVHTCAGELGLSQPYGHVDFYPNGGGVPQPGCAGGNGRWDELQACSHYRAGWFFLESLRVDDKDVNKSFIGRVCNSWDTYKKGQCNDRTPAVLIPWNNTKLRGKYYFPTDSFPPYAKGDVKLP